MLSLDSQNYHIQYKVKNLAKIENKNKVITKDHKLIVKTLTIYLSCTKNSTATNIAKVSNDEKLGEKYNTKSLKKQPIIKAIFR